MTDPAPITASSLVRVDYHTFELADSDKRVPTGFDTSNGLVFSLPGQVVICTGISAGWVTVSVEVRRYPPERVDTDAWDEIVDRSVETTNGALRVASVMSDTPDLPVLTPQGPGTYRVRVHARGRDTVPDGAVDEPVEEYLLIVWPTDRQPDQIHRQSGHYGAQLRAQPSRPAPPVPTAQGDDGIRRRMRERLQRRRTP
ncbi:hypothetical protein [Streptomyces labedae]|uniref:Uncharacterized protein n=2 Tax=Streptomyces TaxID=1883 RepID=A0ABQ2U115_9ACTN|nr:hypothetical protein GCM10010265_61550 [Streptomyces griseoincarnatus]GGT59667.1 hypothetical protein GCM10010287_37410 [Streptomyces variabilis]